MFEKTDISFDFQREFVNPLTKLIAGTYLEVFLGN
jgi:hypothetical protein